VEDWDAIVAGKPLPSRREGAHTDGIDRSCAPVQRVFQGLSQKKKLASVAAAKAAAALKKKQKAE
jgi:hypothetical protein